MNETASLPLGGQLWEATDDCDVQIQYLFTAPITFSGAGRLTRGEQVSIAAETSHPQPLVVTFQPVRYAELHDSLVPLEIRQTPRYKRYLLSLQTDYFHQHFKRVEPWT
jgi:hypothetical protein